MHLRHILMVFVLLHSSVCLSTAHILAQSYKTSTELQNQATGKLEKIERDLFTLETRFNKHGRPTGLFCPTLDAKRQYNLLPAACRGLVLMAITTADMQPDTRIQHLEELYWQSTATVLNCRKLKKVTRTCQAHIEQDEDKDPTNQVTYQAVLDECRKVLKRPELLLSPIVAALTSELLLEEQLCKYSSKPKLPRNTLLNILDKTFATPKVKRGGKRA